MHIRPWAAAILILLSACASDEEEFRPPPVPHYDVTFTLKERDGNRDIWSDRVTVLDVPVQNGQVIREVDGIRVMWPHKYLSDSQTVPRRFANGWLGPRTYREFVEAGNAIEGRFTLLAAPHGQVLVTADLKTRRQDPNPGTSSDGSTIYAPIPQLGAGTYAAVLQPGQPKGLAADAMAYDRDRTVTAPTLVLEVQVDRRPDPKE